MLESPQFVYDIITMMLFAMIGILIYGLVLTRFLVQVLRVRYQIIVPVIFVLCTVGSFAIAARLFDVWVMLAFGVSASCCASRLPDGAARARAGAGRPAGEDRCAAAWCFPTATSRRFLRARSRLCCAR